MRACVTHVSISAHRQAPRKRLVRRCVRLETATLQARCACSIATLHCVRRDASARFRRGCAQRFAVHARAIEATRAPLSGRQHVAGGGNALAPRLGLFPRGDPENPVAPRHRSDVVPGRLRGGCAASAACRSSGTTGSGSTSTGAISSVTVSPAATPAARCSAASSFSQCPPCPSGCSVACNGCPARLPRTLTMLRVGNAPLALAGSTRNTHVASAGVAGCSKVVVKRMAAVPMARTIAPQMAGICCLRGAVLARAQACKPPHARGRMRALTPPAAAVP